MKDRRRFILDKTEMMVVRGRRDATSRQNKKIILLPPGQCQKSHSTAQSGKA